MLKKIISLALALIFALGLLSVNAFADDSATPYADLPMDDFEPNADVTPVRSGYCGNMGSNVSWTLYSDGTLAITGQGKMANFGTSGSTASPWFKNADVKKVVIESGVTSVSNYAFYDCPNLTSITLPDGMNQLGAGFMHGCTQVDEIDIPKSVTAIGPYAFAGCSSLTSVKIPSGVAAINAGTFQNCENLNAVIVTNSVADVKSDIFYKTPNVTIYSYEETYAQDFAKKANTDYDYYSLPGDTNLDYEVDTADLDYVLDHIKSTDTLEGIPADNADIYSDKVIDIRDFNYLYSITSLASDK